MNTRHTWLTVILSASALLVTAVVAPAPSQAADTTASGTTQVDFANNNVKPTTTQAAAILSAATRASSKDMVDCGQAGCYAMVPADINDDGRPDLFIRAQNMGYCGSAGCDTELLMATANGYAPTFVSLAYSGGKISILQGKHHGMHDLRYGDSPVWTWNGSAYRITR